MFHGMDLGIENIKYERKTAKRHRNCMRTEILYVELKQGSGILNNEPQRGNDTGYSLPALLYSSPDDEAANSYFSSSTLSSMYR